MTVGSQKLGTSPPQQRAGNAAPETGKAWRLRGLGMEEGRLILPCNGSADPSPLQLSFFLLYVIKNFFIDFRERETVTCCSTYL